MSEQLNWLEARRKFENIKIDRQQTLNMYFLRDFHMDDLFTSISQHLPKQIQVERKKWRERGEGRLDRVGGGGVKRVRKTASAKTKK